MQTRVIGQPSVVHNRRHQALNPMDKTSKIPTKVLISPCSSPASGSNDRMSQKPIPETAIPRTYLQIHRPEFTWRLK